MSRKRNARFKKKVKKSVAKRRAAKSSWKTRYRSYLRTDKWKAIRIRLFKERGRVCEQCGSRKKIEVHHITYERVFNEKLEDLMVVCNRCHRIIHGR